MSTTYEINDRNEVIPYTSGRRCNDTRAWRDATDLELQQREDIARLESELRDMTAKRDALDDALNELWHYYSLTGAAYELIEKVRADHGNSPANANMEAPNA